MEYTLIINGRSYDLPKFTKSVKNDIEKIITDNESKGLSDDEKYKRMYIFIKKMIGDKNAMEIFETTDLDEMDLKLIGICFYEICNEYDRPEIEAKRNANMSKISEEDKTFVMDLFKNAGNIKTLENFIKQNSSTAGSPFRTL